MQDRERRTPDEEHESLDLESKVGKRELSHCNRGLGAARQGLRVMARKAKKKLL